MAINQTKAYFTVNDEHGGGAGSPHHRVFAFETDFTQPAGGCTVTIKCSGTATTPVFSRSIPLPLATAGNAIPIRQFVNRVRIKDGSLKLLIDGNTRVVMFSGKLFTKSRASVLDVCVAANKP